MIHFTRRDILSLIGYTTLFSGLLFGYNTVLSPSYETTFNSASIRNREEVIIPPAPSFQNDVPESTENASLTIAFNPKNIVLDPSVIARLRQNVDSVFFAEKVTPLQIVLDASRRDPRWQVMGNKLTLSTAIPNDSEMLKVLVHELGHIVDISYLKKWVFSDPSDAFYSLSWESYNVRKKEMKMGDFVSGYALSNKYEDFSESFAFYVFHNDEFARRASSSPILRKKYEFFRTQVFESDEFLHTAFEKAPIASYNWDTTKIPVNTKKYLYYIR